MHHSLSQSSTSYHPPYKLIDYLCILPKLTVVDLPINIAYQNEARLKQIELLISTAFSRFYLPHKQWNLIQGDESDEPTTAKKETWIIIYLPTLSF
ncbi:Hypothetical predicted protein [Octopus vulgaris]|uniref:Uncharacterized protein n=1 Tax=Octopus vulgaris TaxID=6645 RepID=A0AA36BBY7_OCTVU|nr:Hypothetical predicted protein [Octopus vulgaris]